jgi:hypothetical protein
MVETLTAHGKVLCLIVTTEALPSETTFHTNPEHALQVGHIVHSAGHEIPRHIHVPVERQITGTPEVLMVRHGRCQIDVYDSSRHLVATRELAAGDILVLLAGGHGFRMLEDTVLLEVKQGPYAGPAEKEQF